MDGAHPWAWVAQLVEQRIENPRVGGSNPPPGTTPRAAPRFPFPEKPAFSAGPDCIHERRLPGPVLYTKRD